MADVNRLRGENGAAQGAIPADLLTTSGSGLDPHLSPEGALWQVNVLVLNLALDRQLGQRPRPVPIAAP